MQAVYQSLLHLSWVDNLLSAAKALFTKQYATELKKQHLTKLDCRDFDQTFDALVRKLDTGSTRRQSEADSEGPVELTPPSSSASVDGEETHDAPPPVPGLKKPALAPKSRESAIDDTTSTDATPVPTPDASRPSTPSGASHLLTGKAGPGKASRRARKAQGLATSAPVSSGDEASGRRTAKGKSTVKSKRRWDADGFAVEGDDDEVLDYSAPATGDAGEGQRTGKGHFVLKDLDDEVDAILAASSKKQAPTEEASGESGGLFGSASSKITGMFRNVVGGKTLSKEDLKQPLLQMENHLVEKNIAREAAVRLCQSVETDLLNQKTGSFASIDKTIRESMGKALTRILTPTSSFDLLRNITRTIEPPNARPYVISIVGVNGVGKSTNLSKIAYFLLQNQLRVLVVAADTFRSGAVEQLRVHVRNLGELSRREQVGTVDLFEQGYGKDAATVARDAVVHATNAAQGKMLYDVVLIDTAGRRHNDTRLMSSLTKFGQLANPDKIFMVGEALVGSDSVAQARNFAKEFVDTKVCRTDNLQLFSSLLTNKKGSTPQQRRRNGRLHHLQMRHRGRHGWHARQHGPRHWYSRRILGRGPALRRLEGAQRRLGCR
jgi:signal recognition particle receptor subunit alpha